jgi:putative holliday junction resolvase
VAVRDACTLTDAFELPANAAGGVRAVVDVSYDPCDKWQDGRRSRSDQRDCGELAGRPIKLIGDQQTNSKTDGGLRKRNNARNRKVVAKLIEGDRRHLVAQSRFVVWDFQQEMANRRVLGIDPGDVRVGVAVSDDLGMLAHPLETIYAARVDPCERIRELAEESGVRAIIVGVPRNMDGSFGPAAEKSRALIEKLKVRVDCPVIPWDERLTTIAAQRSLREAGKSARKQRPVIDQVAAQILLQGWIDSQP